MALEQVFQSCHPLSEARHIFLKYGNGFPVGCNRSFQSLLSVQDQAA